MPNLSHNNVGRKVALEDYNGIAVISLYLSSIFPTNRLFLCIQYYIFIGYGSRMDLFLLLLYVATTFSSDHCACQDNADSLWIIFRYYGILKYFIEKICNFILEWVLKLLTFNIAMGINILDCIPCIVSNRENAVS